MPPPARAGLSNFKQPAPPDFSPVQQLIKSCEREIRDIASKAQSIEDNAFDLKAVNPNAKTVEDTRTPAELIALIKTKGGRCGNS